MNFLEMAQELNEQEDDNKNTLVPCNSKAIEELKFRIAFLDENIEILEKYVLSESLNKTHVRNSEIKKLKNLKLRRKQRQKRLDGLLRKEN